MTFVVAILLVLVVYGAFRLAQDYVRHSLRSFGSAEKCQTDMIATAERLLDTEPPEGVARLVITVSLMTGCGCFVRGMIASHYLPRVRVGREESESEWTRAFSEADRLPSEQRELFAKFLIQVIIYDSFRNPLQGWILRHTLENIVRPQPSLATTLEAKMTALAVVSSDRRISSYKERLTA